MYDSQNRRHNWINVLIFSQEWWPNEGRSLFYDIYETNYKCRKTLVHRQNKYNNKIDNHLSFPAIFGVWSKGIFCKAYH